MPLTATDTHLSAIFHITKDELKARLTRTDIANGFANRILFAYVKRSKELPFGGDLSDSEIFDLGQRLQNIVDVATGNVLVTGCAQPPERLTMTDAARAEWACGYSALSRGRPGLLGAVTSRAAPQALRLALIFALLDKADQIDIAHLKAGLAVWTYCDEFGSLHLRRRGWRRRGRRAAARDPVGGGFGNWQGGLPRVARPARVARAHRHGPGTASGARAGASGDQVDRRPAGRDVVRGDGGRVTGWGKARQGARTWPGSAVLCPGLSFYFRREGGTLGAG